MNYFHLAVHLILMNLKKKKDLHANITEQIDVIILNKGENLVNLFVRRSFSEHLYSWINDSASRL